MKQFVVGLLASMAAASALAQAPQIAPATASVQVREPPSNSQMGVYADRFIGDPARSPLRMTRDAIMTRTILSAGDPAQPGQGGAALRYRREVVLGQIQAGEGTPLSAVAEQQIIYVAKGQGRLDDGARVWDLKPGYAVLVPPGVAHRMASTGDEPLTMVMMATASPPAESGGAILVRDTAKILYVEQGVHWNNYSKAPFADLGERFLIVYLGSMSLAGPHGHTPDTEEGWVKLTDGASFMQIGSELRAWPAGVGMVAPNNGQTVHAAINTGETLEAWFYFQGRPAVRPTPPTSAPPPGAARRNTPDVFQSSIDATVAPRPLTAARR